MRLSADDARARLGATLLHVAKPGSRSSRVSKKLPNAIAGPLVVALGRARDLADLKAP